MRRRCRGRGGLYNVGTTSLTGSAVTGNRAAAGGGVFEAAGAVTLSATAVAANTPDNCAPQGSVPGCTG
ncbi:hypothetical protein [Streptomyces sp. NPDC091371]|uniref:hypothetical protein n=1 Tax=Streptomyces sp. NPDC091371 TaxID=3155303 RepID=UPI00342B4CE1